MKGTIRQLVGQLHYAFLARPAVGSARRAEWEKHFAATMESFVDAVNGVKLPDLPPTVIGIVYAHNLAIKKNNYATGIDIEAITPAEPGSEHPAITGGHGMRPLPYYPTTEGIVGVIPVEHIRDQWWLEFGAPGPYHIAYRDTNLHRDSGMIVDEPEVALRWVSKGQDRAYVPAEPEFPEERIPLKFLEVPEVCLQFVLGHATSRVYPPQVRACTPMGTGTGTGPTRSRMRDVLEVEEGVGRRDLSALEEGALARRDRANCIQSVVW